MTCIKNAINDSDNIRNMSDSGNNLNDKIIVRIVPFGPNPKSINSITSKLLNRPRVQSYLKNKSDEGLEKKMESKQAFRL
jgi:hypothetical protein